LLVSSREHLRTIDLNKFLTSKYGPGTLFSTDCFKEIVFPILNSNLYPLNRPAESDTERTSFSSNIIDQELVTRQKCEPGVCRIQVLFKENAFTPQSDDLVEIVMLEASASTSMLT
jgi:hypothetical protein